MPGISRIAILTHLRQGLDPDYFLGRIKRLHWEPSGREVIVHQGTRPPPPADIAILHVDLTVVPEEYLALARYYPYCLNAGISDVSKRRVSRWLVERDDGYDGPVIVKHNLNHGGASERRLRLAEGGTFARLREVALRWLPPAWGGHRGSDYQLFQRKGQVPGWVWRRRDLVVERFFVEHHGEGYALNQWFFLGPRSLVSTLVSDQPLVKWHQNIQRLPIHHSVPAEIWQRRAELGIDFGKIDYIVHEGEAVLLDVNPTPHVGASTIRSRNVWTTGVMAAGIDFFDNPRPVSAGQVASLLDSAAARD